MPELRTLLDLLPDPALVVDHDGELIATNSRLDGRWLAVGAFGPRVAALRESPVDARFETPSGELVANIAWQDRMWHGRKVRVARVLDVTAKRQEVRRLQAAVRLLEDSLDSVPVCLAILDELGDIVTANAAWHHAERTRDQSHLHLRDHARVHPRAPLGVGSNYLSAFSMVAAGGEAEVSRILDGIRSVIDGRRRHFVAEYNDDYSVDSRVFQISVSALDGHRALLEQVETTERHRAAATQAEVHAQFRAVFEGALDGLVLFDDEMRIILANPALASILGVDRAGMVGRTLRDVLPESSWLALDASFERLMARGEDEGTLRVILGHEELTLSWHARANFVPGQHVAVVRDVTSANALEQQLRQAQKMDALGQLTGGIAHDLNNLLTVVSAEAELLAEAPQSFADVRVGAREVLTAARRGADMIRKLMAFARNEALSTKPTDVRPLVESAVGIFRRVLPESIDLELSVDDNLPAIDVDPNAVQQVLLNIATNARDAMPDGRGRLVVSAREVAVEHDGTPADGVPTVGHVEIAVSDTGTGMSDRVLARALDPFFTTKAPGKGTGLGLSMAFGLVKRMHGRLHIDSVPQRGTTVRLQFQSTERSPRAEAVRVSQSPSALSSSEYVLLVEDDLALRRVSARLLKRAGFTVLDAGNGDEAWTLLGERWAHQLPGPALILSDIVMPGGGGGRVLDAARAFAPNARLLWMTGHAGVEYEHSAAHAPCAAPILQKPWTHDEFLTHIHDTLRAAPNIPPALSSSASDATAA